MESSQRITPIMYERALKDDQLRYCLDTADQVRDSSDLRQFVADDPYEDAIAQSLQTATQEIESAVEGRVEEVIDRTLEEIPEMIQSRRSSDPHAERMRAEIEAYQKEGSKA